MCATHAESTPISQQYLDWVSFYTLEKNAVETECKLDDSFYIVHSVLTLDEQDFKNTLYNWKYVGKWL